MGSEALQVAVICTISWVLWKYFRQYFVKSPLDNIPGPSSGSWLYGNLRQILHKDGWDFIQHLTDRYPGIAKLHGPFGHRMLYVFDPTALHHIIVKDQQIYEEAAWFIKFNRLRFGPGLLATLGDAHRKQRKMLNPVFSPNHMRRIIPIFDKVGRKLQRAVEGQIRGHNGPVEVDMLVWMSRTALELIGQAGLGYSFDPLVSDTPDEFATAIKMFGPAIVKMNHLRRILPYLPEIGPPTFRAKLVDMFPHDGVQETKRFIDTMYRRSLEIYRGKLQALRQGDEAVAKQVGEGHDIMSILIRANTAAADEDKLPEEEVIAQISTFIFAGMDTTSNALSITLERLADHLDVQQKLRDEILGTFDDQDNFDYDKLVSLPYLDAVCRETLRLYAPVTQVFRETRQDIVLPLSEPFQDIDGKMIQEIPVPKDTTIAVGILSANRNKAIWGEDAMEWKPERWLSPLPDAVTQAKIPGVYANLMTFIGGSRACIGFKFSQLEMKIVLCLLLAKFTFAPSGKKIKWNVANVRFPTVGDNPKPSMPINVGLYRREASE
ncbi:cytochrome P450 [Dichomitus squalens LYAD-421 SS1]|uniref:Cytochrome P450 n=1 Tax=Dichomitus squalens (strain LYAD-421) TaxID=732165 RepID=R7SWF6_DICSQ|nr:cytochrome P450 [Dichomitus squalens LYAD-421 SS1]EJF60519.1 cytochrome P450 [Dichomitus squalens LYAD-421 SS1]